MRIIPFPTKTKEIDREELKFPENADEVWECACGNTLFFVTRTSCICSNCEKEAVFP